MVRFSEIELVMILGLSDRRRWHLFFDCGCKARVGVCHRNCEHRNRRSSWISSSCRISSSTGTKVCVLNAVHSNARTTFMSFFIAVLRNYVFGLHSVLLDLVNHLVSAMERPIENPVLDRSRYSDR